MNRGTPAAQPARPPVTPYFLSTATLWYLESRELLSSCYWPCSGIIARPHHFTRARRSERQAAQLLATWKMPSPLDEGLPLSALLFLCGWSIVRVSYRYEAMIASTSASSRRRLPVGLFLDRSCHPLAPRTNGCQPRPNSNAGQPLVIHSSRAALHKDSCFPLVTTLPLHPSVTASPDPPSPASAALVLSNAYGPPSLVHPHATVCAVIHAHVLLCR